MKRIVSLAFLVLLACAVVANVAFADKKTVTIWYYWETPKHQQTLASVCSDFNASQGNIQVVTKYIPFADFKKQLSIGAAAAELPDIAILDNPDHASYSSMGIFADLTDKLASWPDLKQYFEGPLNSCKLSGRLYGIPFGSNCLALYYNEDMLKAAGVKPPKTWDELKSVSLKLTKGNVHGFAISSLQNEEGTLRVPLLPLGQREHLDSRSTTPTASGRSLSCMTSWQAAPCPRKRSTGRREMS